MSGNVEFSLYNSSLGFAAPCVDLFFDLAWHLATGSFKLFVVDPSAEYLVKVDWKWDAVVALVSNSTHQLKPAAQHLSTLMRAACTL